MHCSSSSPKYEGTASYSGGTPSQSVTEQFRAYWSNGLDHRARRCAGHGGSSQCVQPTHWKACCSSDPSPTPSCTMVSAHCRRSAVMPCIAEERGGARRRVPPPPLPPRHRAPPRRRSPPPRTPVASAAAWAFFSVANTLPLACASLASLYQASNSWWFAHTECFHAFFREAVADCMASVAAFAHMTPGSQPTDIGDHSMCIPCSYAHFRRVPTACVSSPKRLGCLHKLAHAAGHGVFISLAPPHLGAPIPMFEYRSLQKTAIQKIGDNFSRDTVVFCKCHNACFPPRRAPHVQNCCFCCCN